MGDRTPVIVDEVHHPEIRSVGGERVGLRALELLDFMELLRKLGMKESHVKLAAARVVGRMLNPGSEAAAHTWMTEHSAILEWLGIEDAPPSLSTLYRVGDRLWARSTAIMDALYVRTQEVIRFEGTVVFYDLTHVYGYRESEGELPQHGHSKEQRKKNPLVTLALTLDGSGFPVGVDVLPGNVSEPDTLKAALSKLGDARPTLIMDAGMATQANLDWMSAQGFYWICTGRTASPPVPEGDPDPALITASDVKIRAWKLPAPEGEQQVYVHSEARHAVGSRILNRKRARFEAALKDLNAGLSVPRRMKQYDRVLRKVGRLEEQYKQVAYPYKIEVTRAPNGTHARAVTFTHQSVYDARTAALGGYVLRTNRTDWSLDTIVRTCWDLAEIERTFRSLKSELGVRPVWHRIDDRIAAHLFLSVLAYHAVQIIRNQFKKEELRSSWGTLQRELNQWHRISTVLPKDPQQAILLKQDQDLNPLRKQIARILGLQTHRFATKKRINRDAKV